MSSSDLIFPEWRGGVVQIKTPMTSLQADRHQNGKIKDQSAGWYLRLALYEVVTCDESQ
jgi:hypothetical protein